MNQIPPLDVSKVANHSVFRAKQLKKDQETYGNYIKRTSRLNFGIAIARVVYGVSTILFAESIEVSIIVKFI